MASENLIKLQAVINRWAGAGNFDAIVIDGGMGGETENATQNALTAACQLAGDPANATDMICNLMSQMNTAFAAGNGQPYIMANVQTLTSELNAAGDRLSFSPAATVALKPNTPSTPTPNRSQVIVKPPPGMGSLDKARLWFRQQTTVAKAGMGIAGVLVIIGGWSAYSKKKKAA